MFAERVPPNPAGQEAPAPAPAPAAAAPPVAAPAPAPAAEQPRALRGKWDLQHVGMSNNLREVNMVRHAGYTDRDTQIENAKDTERGARAAILEPQL